MLPNLNEFLSLVARLLALFPVQWRISVFVIFLLLMAINSVTDTKLPQKEEAAPSPGVRKPGLKSPVTVMTAIRASLRGNAAVVYNDCLPLYAISSYVWASNTRDLLGVTVRVKITGQEDRGNDNSGACLVVGKDAARGLHLSRDNIVAVPLDVREESNYLQEKQF